MKKTLCAILAVLMLVGCMAACGGTATPSAAPSTAPAPTVAPAAEPTDAPAPEADPFADMEAMTLVYNSTRNEKADAAQIAWLDGLTEVTGGKLQFDVYLSNSLVTSPRDIPDAVTSGICDVAMLNINNYPNMFPLNYNVVSMPFTGITTEARLDIMNYMYENYPELEEEFESQGIKLIGWSTTNSNNLGVKLGKEYTGLADLRGVKIWGSTDIETYMLADAGAVPVATSFPEAYQSLEKNVINGFTNHSGPAFNNGWSDHIDNWVEMGEGAGICVNLVAVVMSLDKWNSLPAAVQEAFIAAEPARAAQELEVQLASDAGLKEVMTGEGKYWVTLDDAQVDEWKALAQPYVDDILAEMEASHPGFGAMYADLCAQLANY